MLVLFVFTLKSEPLIVVVLPLSPNPIVLELISVSVLEGIVILGVVVTIFKISPFSPTLTDSEVLISTILLCNLRVLLPFFRKI